MLWRGSVALSVLNQVFSERAGCIPVLLSALFGLFLGLKMPNLSWTSEITPIKQSACVTIALFSGFGYTALLYVGFMLLNGWKLGFAGYMAQFGGVTLVLCALLWFWLRNKGCSRFASL